MSLPNYLSLGAGVQSSTLLFMAEAGEVTPRPKLAIFADTQAEPESVYKWLEYMKANCSIPILTVTKGSLTKNSLIVRRSKRSGKLYSNNLIPTFILKPDNNKGMMIRRCTRDYKINVVIKAMRQDMGLKAVSKKLGILAISWVGISFDESDRMKPSHTHWIENTWPLVERGITRQDCLDWMRDHGHPLPPRSACVYCPYHNDAEWLRLKNDSPKEFQKAVEAEVAFQKAAAQSEVLDGVPFLHASCIPIGEVVFQPNNKQAGFNRECEGMCGV